MFDVKNNLYKITGLKIVPEVQHLQLSPNPYSPGRNMVSILVSFLLDCFRCMRMCVHTCVCDLHSSVTCCLQFTCTSGMCTRHPAERTLVISKCPCACVCLTFSSPPLLMDSMLSLVFLYHKSVVRKYLTYTFVYL